MCGVEIAMGEPLVATSNFVGVPVDLLYPYADAAMHRTCFLVWPRRAEFVARFNAVAVARVAGNGTFA
jgi:hypothetical protein